MSKIRTKRDSYSGRLTPAQEAALMLGQDPERPVFASGAEMRKAWIEHKDKLGAANIGTRWSGFWLFEADGVDRMAAEGLLWLIEHDALGVGEANQLRAFGGAHWPAEAAAAWEKRQEAARG